VLEKIKSPTSRDPSTENTLPIKAGLFNATELQPEHSAAMTLGMLSGGMTPNTAALFGSVQSPGGTNYPAIDPALSAESADMTPEFPGEMLTGFNNPSSPFSMFNNMADNMDFTTNFDWESFQNYAQSGNFGTDQSFGQFFSQGNTEQPQPGSTTESSAGYSFSAPSMGDGGS